MHKSQVLFLSLLAFICGVFVASFVLVSQKWILVFLICAIGLIAISGYQITYSKKGFLVGALFLVFIFGIIRFNSFNFANSILNQFADVEVGGKGMPVTMSGYVDEEPNIKGDRTQLIFRVKELIVSEKKLTVDERTLIYANAFPRYKFGDELSVTGALKIPKNFSAEGGSASGGDYITYLKKQNIRTVMSFPKIINERYDSLIYHNVGFFEEVKVGLYKKIFGLKNKFELAINKSISEPNASFVNGILLGSRQNIPEETKEAFNKTGTTHILAISGYNIMIISWAVLAGLVYFFRRRTAFWISVAVIILFTILTGASSSVVRASIMGLLLLFANGYSRLYDPKNSIILAGTAMVYINPFTLVFDIGFQLSFVAVIGLVYLYPKIDNKLKKMPKFGKLKEIFLMTLSAQIVVAPLLIYYFKNFYLVSLLANVLILPFLPAAMFFGFISGLAGMVFLPLGQATGWFAWAITTYQIEIIELFALL